MPRLDFTKTSKLIDDVESDAVRLDGVAIYHRLWRPVEFDVHLIGKAADLPGAQEREELGRKVYVQLAAQFAAGGDELRSTTVALGRVHTQTRTVLPGGTLIRQTFKCSGMENNKRRVTSSTGIHIARATTGKAQIQALGIVAPGNLNVDGDPAPGDFRYTLPFESAVRIARHNGWLLRTVYGRDYTSFWVRPLAEWQAASDVWGRVPGNNEVIAPLALGSVTELAFTERLADHVDHVIVRGGDVVRNQTFTGVTTASRVFDLEADFGTEAVPNVAFLTDDVAVDAANVSGDHTTPDAGLRYRDRVEVTVDGDDTVVVGTSNRALFLGSVSPVGWGLVVNGDANTATLTHDHDADDAEAVTLGGYGVGLRAVGSGDRWVAENAVVETVGSGIIRDSAGDSQADISYRAVCQLASGAVLYNSTNNAVYLRAATQSTGTLEAYLGFDGTSGIVATSGNTHWLRRLVTRDGKTFYGQLLLDATYNDEASQINTAHRLVEFHRSASGVWSVPADGVNVETEAGHLLVGIDGNGEYLWFVSRETNGNVFTRRYSAATGARAAGGDVQFGQLAGQDFLTLDHRTVNGVALGAYIGNRYFAWSTNPANGAQSAYVAFERKTSGLTRMVHVPDWSPSVEDTSLASTAESPLWAAVAPRFGAPNRSLVVAVPGGGSTRGFRWPVNRIQWNLPTGAAGEIKDAATADATFDVVVIDCGVEGVDCPEMVNVGQPIVDVQEVQAAYVVATSIGRTDLSLNGETIYFDRAKQQLVFTGQLPGLNESGINTLHVRWAGRLVTQAGAGTIAARLEDADNVQTADDARTYADALFTRYRHPVEQIRFVVDPEHHRFLHMGYFILLSGELQAAAGVREPDESTPWLLTAVSTRLRGQHAIQTVTAERDASQESVAEWWRGALRENG